MTFESVESRERFEEDLISRLANLSSDKLALFALAACEHLRCFVAYLASVAPPASELMSGLWERASGGDRLLDFDVAPLEQAIADHMETVVGGELEALALERNAGLGLALSLLAEWADTRDVAVLVRLATMAIGEFSEISAVEAAEKGELTQVAEWLQETDATVDQTRRRAQAHGQEMAQLARSQWAID